MKKFLSLVLALVMTMSLVTISAGAKDFTDSADINYDEAVDVMSALEIIDGYAGGDFQPQGTLTRGAAAKIIACMMLGKTTAESLGNQAAPFKDVPAGSTFAGYIAYCVETGIVDGYADGTFRPSNKLTGFAFLKMLLTAMGYDSAVESFTGTNWTVNVARLAIENGLTDGNDDFVGTELATREEACLYAVNTLKATLVEYESKGSQISINGAVISAGATQAKPVTTKVVSTQTINSAKTVDGEWTVEFAEKYQPKLVLTGESDAFCRPANVWTYKDKEVGTYTKTADLTYTEKVTSGEVYADLGLTSSKTVTEYYEDGVKQNPVLLEKANTVSANKVGAQGTETTVYYNTTTGVVTICEVNTYVADVVAKYAASGNKDAYIRLGQRETNSGNTPYASLVNFGTYNTFDTEDFAVDDIVLFTYSNKAGEIGVQSVKTAETVTGSLTSYTEDKSATVGGTTYKYAEKIASEATAAFLYKSVDATVVLDQYGNAIDITDKGVQNYAVVLKLKNNAGDYNDTAKANLLLTDGTVVEGVNLTNNAVRGTATQVYSGSANAGTTIDNGDIVSYTINNKDKYTLTYLAADADTALSITNNSAAITGAAGAGNYTANGKTIFLVVSGTDSDPIYNAYEGIKAVPTITDKGGHNTTNAVYAKANNIATVVYVDVRNTANINTTDVIFVQGDDDPGATVDTVYGRYYTYDAIVNGDIVKLNVADIVADDALFDSVSYTTYSDGAKVATLSNKVDVNHQHDGSMVNGMHYYVGVQKLTNGSIGLSYQGGNYYATSVVPADDCKVFYVNADEDITASSVSAIATDSDDLVFVKIVNGEATTIVVVAQPVNKGSTVTADFTIANVTAARSADDNTLQVTVTGTAASRNLKNTDKIVVTLTKVNATEGNALVGSQTITCAGGAKAETVTTTSLQVPAAGNYIVSVKVQNANGSTVSSAETAAMYFAVV